MPLTAPSPRTAGAALAVLVLAGIFAGCGGGPRTEVASAGPGGTVTGGPAAADADAADAGGVVADSIVAPEMLDAGGPNQAVVTIGQQRYLADFSDRTAICLPSEGGITAIGTLAGFTDGRITIDLPPHGWEDMHGWEAPTIRLELGVDGDGVPIELHAGGEVVSESPELSALSVVGSYTIDDVRASGTATFVDLGPHLGGSTGDGAAGPEGSTGAVRPLEGLFALECD